MNALEWAGLRVTRRFARVPRHVAFIMDGNRRFARRRGEKSVEGHSHGYDSLLKVLEWSLELGVKVATVFAFSLENFKRSKEEVDALMRLAEDKFEDFLDHKHLVMAHKVRVKVLGDLDLLPESLRKKAEQVMAETRSHDALLLNVCFAYSSGQELVQVMRKVVARAREGTVKEVTEDLMKRSLFTEGEEPELLIRTSGETRLSDFLVWQSNWAHISFLQGTWPELTCFDFLTCVWDYHAHCSMA